MTDHLASLLLTDARLAGGNWAAWLKQDSNAIRLERRLLTRLSGALERSEMGSAGPGEVEHARRALRSLYRALGMHP